MTADLFSKMFLLEFTFKQRERVGDDKISGTTHMTLYKRILIVRPDRMGDVMLASGIPSALKQKVPSVYIGFLVQPATASLLQGNKDIDEIIIDEGESLFKLSRKIRKSHFDCALLLVQSKRHTWVVRLAGIPNRFGIGGKPYEFLCGIRGLGKKKRDGIRHQSGIDILARTGMEIPLPKPVIELFADEKQKARLTLKTYGVFPNMKAVGLQITHGGSSANWPVEQWILLADKLCEQGYFVIAHAFGLPTDQKKRMTDHFHGKLFYLLSDLSIRTLAGLFSQCCVFIGPNTGPLHLAAGVNTHAIGLFCALPTLQFESWGLPGEIPIFPEKNGCENCQGPKDCSMSGISVERILEELNKIILR